MIDITGIILAGGKSSRMGSDKGLIEFNGKPMIQHIIDRFNELNLPILIIANNPAYSKFGYPVVEDLIKDKGPVGGIYTGLMTSNSDRNLIVSCDMPNISSQLLEHLINQSKGHPLTIPHHGQRLHPLIGVYSKSTLDSFKASLKNDQLRLSSICSALDAKIITLSDDLKINLSADFSNINTLQDIKQQAI